MIACDGKNCTIEWFHWSCVGITEPPEGNWYCLSCQKEDINRTTANQKSKKLPFKTSLTVNERKALSEFDKNSNDGATTSTDNSTSYHIDENCDQQKSNTIAKTNSLENYKIPKLSRNNQQSKSDKENVMYHSPVSRHRSMSVASHSTPRPNFSHYGSDWTHKVQHGQMPHHYSRKMYHRNHSRYFPQYQPYNQNSKNEEYENKPKSFDQELADYQIHRNRLKRSSSETSSTSNRIISNVLNHSQSDHSYNCR